MNAPHFAPFDARTVESHAPPMGLVTALKPGAFFDAFKSAAARPLWARNQDMRVPESAPEHVRPAVQVRASELQWSDWEGAYARNRARAAQRAEWHSVRSLGYSLYAANECRDRQVESNAPVNRAFWKHIEDSLNGGPPACELDPAVEATLRALVLAFPGTPSTPSELPSRPV